MAKLKVTQTGSPIGRPEYQRQNLISLGLNKRHRSKVVNDTPENRGRIARVRHLVVVEPLPEADADGQAATGAATSGEA